MFYSWCFDCLRAGDYFLWKQNLVLAYPNGSSNLEKDALAFSFNF